MTEHHLTDRQREVLEIIDQSMRERGYPPSVREIGEAVGLTSPSTVHSHLNTLQRLGFLRRDPTKPRAIEVRWDPNSGASLERRPARYIPLVGDVAAGILDGDYVVARVQPTADKGDIVVAGLPGEEATVKTYSRKGNKVVLQPANPR